MVLARCTAYKHVIITIRPGISVCQCGIREPGKASLKGLKEEVDRLLDLQGGLEAMQDRLAKAEEERLKKAKEARQSKKKVAA